MHYDVIVMITTPPCELPVFETPWCSCGVNAIDICPANIVRNKYVIITSRRRSEVTIAHSLLTRFVGRNHHMQCYWLLSLQTTFSNLFS